MTSSSIPAPPLSGPGIPAQPHASTIGTSMLSSQAQTVTTPTPSSSIMHLILHDIPWPTDLILNINRANWDSWSKLISLTAQQQGFIRWLKGTLPQPDLTSHSIAHDIWANNDDSLKAFLLKHILDNDYDLIVNVDTAYNMFEKLCKRHEKLGLHTQVLLLKKALNICCTPNVPLSNTVMEVSNLLKCIAAMGPIDIDKLKSVVLINTLSGHYEHIQSTLIGLTNDPSFTSDTIIHCIQQEEDIIH